MSKGPTWVMATSLNWSDRSRRSYTGGDNLVVSDDLGDHW